MATPKDYVLYQGFFWTKDFVVLKCDKSPFDLTDYTFSMPIKTGVGVSTLQTLTIGNGLTIDLVTAKITAAITAEQSAAWNLSTMPIRTVTEYLGPDTSCCNGDNSSETITETGPTGVYNFIATNPDGNILPPWMTGSICVVPAQ